MSLWRIACARSLRASSWIANPAKQGCVIPATAVPIIAPEDPRLMQLDLILVANPNYVSEVESTLDGSDSTAPSGRLDAAHRHRYGRPDPRATRTDEGERSLPLYSDEAFEIVSREWVKVGWNQRYPYTFTWMGRPLIQLPEDLVRIQEVIWDVRPDVILETGVAHGGSLIFYASLCKAMGTGRVIGIDIEIRAANRAAIEAHPLAPLITLIEGDSTAPETVARAASSSGRRDGPRRSWTRTTAKAHVRRELEAYHSLVSPGSYIVATDGIMRDLHDVPTGVPGGVTTIRLRRRRSSRAIIPSSCWAAVVALQREHAPAKHHPLARCIPASSRGVTPATDDVRAGDGRARAARPARAIPRPRPSGRSGSRRSTQRGSRA